MAASTSVLERPDARRALQRLIEERVAEQSDYFYTYRKHYDVRAMARAATQAFPDNKSQMNGLERVALSASTYGEIANYIKSQLGRETKTGERWKEGGFGYDLVDELDRATQSAEGDASRLLESLPKTIRKAMDKDELKQLDFARKLRLGYARAYVQHVVAHYNFLIS